MQVFVCVTIGQSCHRPDSFPDCADRSVVFEYVFDAIGGDRRQIGTVPFEGNGRQLSDYVMSVGDIQILGGGTVPLKFTSDSSQNCLAPPLLCLCFLRVIMQRLWSTTRPEARLMVA